METQILLLPEVFFITTPKQTLIFADLFKIRLLVHMHHCMPLSVVSLDDYFSLTLSLSLMISPAIKG